MTALDQRELMDLIRRGRSGLLLGPEGSIEDGAGLLARVQNSSRVPRFGSGGQVELTWDPADAQALVE